MPVTRAASAASTSRLLRSDLVIHTSSFRRAASYDRWRVSPAGARSARRSAAPCLQRRGGGKGEGDRREESPADEERDAADRRDGAEYRHAAERQRVKTAREDDDTGGERPAGPVYEPAVE